jgi:hypothetical protein
VRHGILFPKIGVPKDRCSEEWVLDRSFQEGVGIGIKNARVSFPVWAKRILVRKVKLFGIRALIALVRKRISSRQRFHYEYLMTRYAGIVKGLQDTNTGNSI